MHCTQQMPGYRDMQLRKSERGASLCTEGILVSFKDAQINFSYPCVQSFIQMVDAIGEVLAGHADHAAFPVLQVALFEASYERYLSVALQHLEGRNAAQTGKALMEKVLTHQRVNQKPGKKHGEALKPWVEMPKSRLECCLALKKFLEYAVAEHRQPKAFLVSDRDYLEVRGADGKSRKKLFSPMQKCWS